MVSARPLRSGSVTTTCKGKNGGGVHTHRRRIPNPERGGINPSGRYIRLALIVRNQVFVGAKQHNQTDQVVV